MSNREVRGIEVLELHSFAAVVSAPCRSMPRSAPMRVRWDRSSRGQSQNCTAMRSVVRLRFWAKRHSSDDSRISKAVNRCVTISLLSCPNDGQNPMQHVLVIQSAAEQAPAWQKRCMGSVQKWATSRGYAYRFLGDELFEQVPDWHIEKVRGRMPIAADLGRLQWIERLLSEGYSWVLWFDAGMLVFAPSRLDIALGESCIFGQEHWVQAKANNVSHATSIGSVRWWCAKHSQCLCGFSPGLSGTTVSCRSYLAHDETGRPRPYCAANDGTELLSSLHSLAAFDHVAEVGALSPDVLRQIATGTDRGAMKALCDAQPKLSGRRKFVCQPSL